MANRTVSKDGSWVQELVAAFSPSKKPGRASKQGAPHTVHRVRQERTTSCGVAVVAMLARVSHREAMKVMFPRGGRDFRTHYSDLRRALVHFGVPHAQRAIRCSSWDKVPTNAIAGVRGYDESDRAFYHWVIAQRKGGRVVVLDPGAEGQTLTLADPELYELQSYLPVEPRKPAGQQVGSRPSKPREAERPQKGVSIRRLGDLSVEQARQRELASEIAAATGMSLSAVRGRLSRKHGRTLVRKAFADNWPSTLGELGGESPATIAADEVAIRQIAKALGAKPAQLRTRLERAPRGSTARQALEALWRTGTDISDEELGSLTVSGARAIGVSGRVASFLGVEEKQVTRRLERAHGASHLNTVFAGDWPPTSKVARSAQNPSALVVGRYEKVRVIGEGHFGKVWLARDLAHTGESLVALKFLKSVSDPEAVQREFTKACELTHPNLCKYHRVHRSERAEPLFVIEYGGDSLAQVAAHPVPVGKAIAWIRSAAEGLDFLRDNGLQHLDVKPSNILLGADGQIRLTDFGTVVALTRRKGIDGKTTTLPTSTVEAMTLQYSAPEVVNGRPSHWSDQYSLALTFAELVAGKHGREMAAEHERLGALSADQNAALLRALQANKAKRFPTCIEFAEALSGRA